eukprot:933434-Pelagomonas_calceolata.AAC.18
MDHNSQPITLQSVLTTRNAALLTEHEWSMQLVQHYAFFMHEHYDLFSKSCRPNVVGAILHPCMSSFIEQHSSGIMKSSKDLKSPPPTGIGKNDIASLVVAMDPCNSGEVDYRHFVSSLVDNTPAHHKLLQTGRLGYETQHEKWGCSPITVRACRLLQTRDAIVCVSYPGPAVMASPCKITMFKAFVFVSGKGLDKHCEHTVCRIANTGPFAWPPETSSLSAHAAPVNAPHEQHILPHSAQPQQQRSPAAKQPCTQPQCLLGNAVSKAGVSG